MSFQFKASMTCAISGIFFACTAPALAHAEPVVVMAPSDYHASTRVFSCGDLDLTIPHNQQRLDRRLSAAIKNVCGLSEYEAVRTITARAPYVACSNEAWIKARAEMGAAIALAQGLGAGGIEIPDRAITVSARASD